MTQHGGGLSNRWVDPREEPREGWRSRERRAESGSGKTPRRSDGRDPQGRRSTIKRVGGRVATVARRIRYDRALGRMNTRRAAASAAP